MGLVKIKIDGKEVEVEEGKTILQVAKELGIDIPTLCNFEALNPVGACRMCLVDAGPGALKPSCVTPVQANMDIKTDSPAIEEARQTVLYLLFSERNHYCMYCESSGDCELQNLGYRFKMDHFLFAPYRNSFRVDASHEYILFDHNRCVLCTRCIRACNELAGHHVLDVKNRGFDSLVSADLDVQFGNSTCVSCGLCVQVCPTGALVDKRASFLGRNEQSEIYTSNCDRCAVGCGTEIYKRNNYILKIYGDFNSPINDGVLCKKGRYLPLYDFRKRVKSSVVKESGNYKDIKTDDVYARIAENPDDVSVYVDGNTGLENLHLLKTMFKDRVFSIGETETLVESNASLSDLKDADAFLVIGTDLNREYGVIGSYVKRKIYSNQSRLILVDGEFNSMVNFAHSVFDENKFDLALDEAKKYGKVVVLYSKLKKEIAETLKNEKSFKYLFLPYETNTLGLRKMGIKRDSGKAGVSIFIGEDLVNLRKIAGDSLVIALTPFENNDADMIVPISSYFEEESSFINIEGKTLKRKKILEQPAGVLELKDVLIELSRRLGIKVDIPGFEGMPL
jgi:formate dehydrogenase major subunit